MKQRYARRDRVDSHAIVIPVPKWKEVHETYVQVDKISYSIVLWEHKTEKALQEYAICLWERRSNNETKDNPFTKRIGLSLKLFSRLALLQAFRPAVC